MKMMPKKRVSKYVFKEENVEALREELQITEVLSWYGYEPSKNRFYKCPDPNHPDKNPSASVKNNRCHCFSCGRTFDALAVVMENEPCSFVEALEKAVDTFGLSTACYTLASEAQEEREDDRFPLDMSDVELLGFKHSSRTEAYYTGADGDFVEVDGFEIPLVTRADGGAKVSSGYTNLSALWKEDRAAFDALVYSKATELIEAAEESRAALEAQGDAEGAKAARFAIARLTFIATDARDRNLEIKAMDAPMLCDFSKHVEFSELSRYHYAAQVGTGPSKRPLLAEVYAPEGKAYARIYELAPRGEELKIPYSAAPPHIKREIAQLCARARAEQRQEEQENER